MHDADVRTEGDLEPAAQRVAVHRGDHRHLQLLPHPAHLLPEVGDTTRGQRARVAIAPATVRARGKGLEGGEVEPGAERCALPRQHDRPDGRLGLQALARRRQGGEHRPVERVALLRAVEADVGDTVVADRNGHPITHRVSLA
jgi:hypothetical protein